MVPAIGGDVIGGEAAPVGNSPTATIRLGVSARTKIKAPTPRRRLVLGSLMVSALLAGCLAYLQVRSPAVATIQTQLAADAVSEVTPQRENGSDVAAESGEGIHADARSRDRNAEPVASGESAGPSQATAAAGLVLESGPAVGNVIAQTNEGLDIWQWRMQFTIRNTTRFADAPTAENLHAGIHPRNFTPAPAKPGGEPGTSLCLAHRLADAPVGEDAGTDI